MIVTLCGSIRFKGEFETEAAKLTEQGHVVLMPATWEHLPDYRSHDKQYYRKVLLQFIHNQRIDISDRIHIINKDGYVGHSTIVEIKRAERLEIIVTYMED